MLQFNLIIEMRIVAIGKKRKRFIYDDDGDVRRNQGIVRLFLPIDAGGQWVKS